MAHLPERGFCVSRNNRSLVVVKYGMTNHHGNKTNLYDQTLAHVNQDLDRLIGQAREDRKAKAERFGQIDEYRIVRDEAEVLLHHLTSESDRAALAFLLATALNRLAQLPDSTDELEAIFDLDAPEGSQE